MSNKIKQSKTPAIVIGGGINALGVVRSLGPAGVPIIVLDTEITSPAMRSRYGRKMLVPALEGLELINCLKILANELPGQAMLFLTEEKTINTVSEQRAQLPPNLLIRLPDHQRLMQLMHKQGFQELAEACAAPIPRTVRLEGLQDLTKLHTLNFPCVLKPSKKNYTYGAHFKKAYKVNSANEVAKLYAEIEPILADMVVQEWIEGSDAEIYFCMQYIGQLGEVIGSFCGRKIRSWPPRIGGTASCTAAWEQASELSETTRAFFQQTGFTGMGSMEYKRDARNGRFFMVEPTVARTDFQEEIATINGCNLVLAAYCYECGIPLEPVHPVEPPRIWRDAQADRWSFEEGDGVIDQPSQSHKIVDSYWRWNDPLPWIDFISDRIAQRLRWKN
ncbi:MAG: carboxylate--amine ligase [Undibacterium sp.]|uniref:carboxylate--amine ligase n=1 Tax=Undibacterium sp. TaxID=1914977 RepID=UPI00271B351F|nr:carboxylate--amine ligase [Undibacterium sp.]MDO8651350.1 carboxylate--amine ligase [Undibacterium sp.]